MSHADLFLARLGGQSMTFQTFDDRKKRGHLAKVFHGQYPDIRNKLVPLNQGNVGIFVTVNETDLAGRKTENITHVRALFADLDGSPLDPVVTADLQPHMVIESSSGRYHAYWIVDDCPLAEFPVYQKAIARRFDSDPKVHDLPRVMRLPGFYHCKDAPYPTHIIDLNWVQAYKRSQIREGLQLELRLQKTTTVSSRMMTNGSQKYGATEESRNDSLFRMAGARRTVGIRS